MISCVHVQYTGFILVDVPVISKSARIWHPSAMPVLLNSETAILLARVAFSHRPGMFMMVYGMYHTRKRIPPAAAPELAEMG